MPKFNSRTLLPVNNDKINWTKSQIVEFSELGIDVNLSRIADHMMESFGNKGLDVSHSIPSPLAYLASMKQNLQAEPSMRNKQLYQKWLGVFFMIAMNDIYGFDIHIGTIQLNNESRLFNQIFYDCLKSDENYTAERLILFYRGEKRSQKGSTGTDKPFAFVHREIGICPFNEIDADILSDVDWYDNLNDRWLDPIELLFKQSPDNPTPSKKIASALIDWMYNIQEYSQNIPENRGHFYNALVDEIVNSIKSYFIREELTREPLKLESFKSEKNTVTRNFANELSSQGVSPTIAECISFGFEIPNIFTKKMLAVHKEMFPELLNEFSQLEIDENIRFLPPLRCDFVGQAEKYNFKFSEITFKSSGSGESEMIIVRVPVTIVSEDDNSVIIIYRCGRYSVVNDIRFLANCPYLSVWPSVKIAESMWQKYYIGIFKGINELFECNWRDNSFKSSHIFTQDKVKFLPAVAADSEGNRSETHSISSNVGRVEEKWIIHTTKTFPDYISIYIDENETERNVEYGVIPVKNKDITSGDNPEIIMRNDSAEIYCVAVDFGTTNTHCAVGQRNTPNIEAYPEDVTTTKSMLPLELSSGADMAKHLARVNKISMCYWVPRMQSQNSYISTASQIFSKKDLATNIKPLIDGRIIDLSADVFRGIYISETNKRALVEEDIYTGIKVLKNEGEAQYDNYEYAVRVFLTNMLLTAALFVIVNKKAQLPLNLGFSYPSSEMGKYVKSAFGKAINYVNDFIGCTVYSGIDLACHITEARSVSKFHELRESGASRAQGFVTVDIGGGTMDISINKSPPNEIYTTNRGNISIRYAGQMATIESFRDILKHAPKDKKIPNNIFNLMPQLFKDIKNNEVLIETYADLSEQYKNATSGKNKNGIVAYNLENTLTPIIEALIKSCDFKTLSDINREMLTLRSVLRAKVIAICYFVAKYIRFRGTRNEYSPGSKLFEYSGMRNLDIFFAGNGARLIELSGLNTEKNLKILSQLIEKQGEIPTEYNNSGKIDVKIILHDELLKKEVSDGMIYYMRMLAKENVQFVENDDDIIEEKVNEKEKIIFNNEKVDILIRSYESFLEILKEIRFDETDQPLWLYPLSTIKNSWTIYDALNLKDVKVKTLFNDNFTKIYENVFKDEYPHCLQYEAFAVLMFNHLISILSGKLFTPS